MSEWLFVGVSYGLTWLVLGGYALTLHRRVARAESRLRAGGAGAHAWEESSV